MEEGLLLLLELVLMFLLLRSACRRLVDMPKRDLGLFAFHEVIEPKKQPNKISKTGHI